MKYIKPDGDILSCVGCGKHEFHIVNDYMDHESGRMKWTICCDTCGRYRVVDNTYTVTNAEVCTSSIPEKTHEDITEIKMIHEEVKKLRLDFEIFKEMFNNVLNMHIESAYPSTINIKTPRCPNCGEYSDIHLVTQERTLNGRRWYKCHRCDNEWVEGGQK